MGREAGRQSPQVAPHGSPDRPRFKLGLDRLNLGRYFPPYYFPPNGLAPPPAVLAALQWLSGR